MAARIGSRLLNLGTLLFIGVPFGELVIRAGESTGGKENLFVR
jgi:hypothetical protein